MEKAQQNLFRRAVLCLEGKRRITAGCWPLKGGRKRKGIQTTKRSRRRGETGGKTRERYEKNPLKKTRGEKNVFPESIRQLHKTPSGLSWGSPVGQGTLGKKGCWGTLGQAVGNGPRADTRDIFPHPPLLENLPWLWRHGAR